MELKKALRAAVEYVSQIESLSGKGESAESFLSNGGVAIEGVKYDDVYNVWDVSVGFFRPWNRNPVGGFASNIRAMSQSTRTIKTVVIDNQTGDVVDYRPYALVTA